MSNRHGGRAADTANSALKTTRKKCGVVHTFRYGRRCQLRNRCRTRRQDGGHYGAAWIETRVRCSGLDRRWEGGCGARHCV